MHKILLNTSFSIPINALTHDGNLRLWNYSYVVIIVRLTCEDMLAISIVSRFLSDVQSTAKRSQSIMFYCGLGDVTSLHLQASTGQMTGALSIVSISKHSLCKIWYIIRQGRGLQGRWRLSLMLFSCVFLRAVY